MRRSVAGTRSPFIMFVSAAILMSELASQSYDANDQPLRLGRFKS